MPVGSGYEDASLDALVNSWTAGTRWALFDDDPTNGGVELDTTSCPGYTSPAFATSDFAASSGGVKDLAAAKSFGAPSAAWTEVGAYIAILDASAGVVWFDDLDESQVVAVYAAQADVSVSSVPIFFTDEA